MALGASRAAIFSSIVRESLTLVLIGIVTGFAVAFALSRFLSSLLFGVSTTDPITLLAVLMLVILVACLASYFPARRAASLDPMTAPRYE